MPLTLNKKSISPIGQLIKSDSNLLSFLKTGDLVEAKLLAKTPRRIYFDLGKFGTGILYGVELANSRGAVKDLEIGQMASAKVLDLDGEEGAVELSLSGAHKQKNWQEIKEWMERGEVLTINVIGANSGGLVAEVNGIKAFLPVSQLAVSHYPRVPDADKGKILEELRKLTGAELKVKIIDFNPRNNKLILSEKEATDENVKDMIAKYAMGDIIDGIVSGIADFGVFVRFAPYHAESPASEDGDESSDTFAKPRITTSCDNGAKQNTPRPDPEGRGTGFADNPALEGLIHISELDHRLIESPKEVVELNQAIKAKIIDIKDGQISLSLKALMPNPWDNVLDKFKEGEEASGTLYKFNPFGAHVNLDGGFHGLLHISEFGGAEEMRTRLLPGVNHQFIIESIKPEEKRIILKLKR